MKNNNLTEFVETALFIAIIFILTFVPNLGYIPINPAINVTTIHIPVIIGSIILGSKKGSILGFAFGLSSFIKNTFFSTSAMSFVFSPLTHITVGYYLGALYSIIICFVPRILVGIVPHYIYKWAKTKLNDSFSLFLAGIGGSMTNTILVMNMIGIFFKNEYMKILGAKAANGIFYFIIVTTFTNGLIEAIVAAILSATIVKSIMAAKKRI